MTDDEFINYAYDKYRIAKWSILSDLNLIRANPELIFRIYKITQDVEARHYLKELSNYAFKNKSELLNLLLNFPETYKELIGEDS